MGARADDLPGSNMTLLQTPSVAQSPGLVYLQQHAATLAFQSFPWLGAAAAANFHLAVLECTLAVAHMVVAYDALLDTALTLVPLNPRSSARDSQLFAIDSSFADTSPQCKLKSLQKPFSSKATLVVGRFGTAAADTMGTHFALTFAVTHVIVIDVLHASTSFTHAFYFMSLWTDQLASQS